MEGIGDSGGCWADVVMTGSESGAPLDCCRVLKKVKETFDVPIITDIHDASQVPLPLPPPAPSPSPPPSHKNSHHS